MTERKARPTRLSGMAGIGVDRMGNLADQVQDPEILRLENLYTDIPVPPGVLEATKGAIGNDSANSYLPFAGNEDLRQEATALVSRLSGVSYDWKSSCLIS